MQKHLFLTGPACSGKSEMIKSVLGGRLAYAGGYVIVRAGGQNGAPPGCDLLPAAAAAGVEGYESASILSFSGTRLTHDNEVFREAGVHLLEEAGFYPFAVLDEIGGFEFITLLAGAVQPYLTAEVITEMTAVGGPIFLAMSVNLIGLREEPVKVGDMIPAIFLPILYFPIAEFIGGLF